MSWVVLLQPNALHEHAYGPFESRDLADRFAANIDPAHAVSTIPLFSPEPNRPLAHARSLEADGTDRPIRDPKTTLAAAGTAAGETTPTNP